MTLITWCTVQCTCDLKYLQRYYYFLDLDRFGTYILVCRIINVLVDGSTGCRVLKRGGTKLERFLPKNQHAQRKLLNFENWTKICQKCSTGQSFIFPK